MDDVNNSLIGETVIYSIMKDEAGKTVTGAGTILDKVLMVNKLGETHVITGYLIDNHKTGKIVQIAAWRLLELVPQKEENFNKQ